MYSISKKIHLLKQAAIAKNFFSNDEISRSAATEFTCCDCGHHNTIEIVPYESGFPIVQLYNEDKVVSQSELLHNKLVTETSGRMLHFGALTVNDLPTLYFGTDCESCHSKYVCVFSYGEKQPGLTVLNISGIWKYEELR
ncbi:hypothetical protein B0A69_13105 [Chryseobacterium shigense]|uniref:Uncharacterized protein n=1 Tax=Chryseobacterium shigense TaxID=297244 RepID=A0A1N7HTC0_9FLAO|nr:hypothetical protein [Chryseobacterium shigense]PQA93091.1 hypothetical protein B0A69_13105 [Chryseobacterium shigense]SIS28104.1 hypothetical protein SAMN05421639_10176 [Chryseobacterium shigense]